MISKRGKLQGIFGEVMDISLSWASGWAGLTGDFKIGSLDYKKTLVETTLTIDGGDPTLMTGSVDLTGLAVGEYTTQLHLTGAVTNKIEGPRLLVRPSL